MLDANPEPCVSVVMSVYNDAQFLPAALDSILAQQGVDFELIVINDGSSDSSGTILADYASRDDRLRVLDQANSGLTTALIRGCQQARGEFIARHDSDDMSVPDRLCRQVAFLRANPGVALVSCATRYIGPNGEFLSVSRGADSVQAATAQLRAADSRQARGPVHGSVMFRREAYERAGGYRPAFRFAQDYDLWMRLTDAAAIGFLPETLYQFRVRTDSISMTLAPTQRALADIIVACCAARGRGEDERPLLDRAEQTCEAGRKAAPSDGFAGNYFLGRLLLDRRDPDAKTYLSRAVRARPWSLKAGVSLALAQCLTLGRRGRSAHTTTELPDGDSPSPGSDAGKSTAGEPFGITIAIPTYGREQVLVETVAAVLAHDPPAEEVLIVDQTHRHEPATDAALAEWDRIGAIRWIRLERPSITASMNRALLLATQPILLFLDDDIVPDARLIAAHRSAHAAHDVWAVVGQILQPGQESMPVEWHPTNDRLQADLVFPFYSDRPQAVYNCMAGNLSLRRQPILSIGGFDENFVGAAYRFETECARRIWRSGGQIWFEPAASIRHLQAARGGTRSYGSHLRSMRPEHSVGDYYYALSAGLSAANLAYCCRRFARSVLTRYHAAHPWWIGPKLIGELRGADGGRVWPCGAQGCCSRPRPAVHRGN